jgi:glutamate 5-kinase
MSQKAEKASRLRLGQVKRLVVKIGSSSLTRAGNSLDRRVMNRLVEDIAQLRAAGLDVALVSSGAVAAGMGRLGLQERPRQVASLQAAAAVGQNLLMHAYESAFQRRGVTIGQVLLTAGDILDDRRRYLNLRNTFRQLFSYGAVPLINENDSVGVAELKRQIGENDVLAAYVANLVGAELLVLLSDIEGLYAGYGPNGPQGEPLSLVRSGDDFERMAGRSGSGVGSGGMATKLKAARLMTACGEMALIAHARRHRLVDILAGAPLGTLFVPQGRRLKSRKRWIAFASPHKGTLVVDAGAEAALVHGGKSLLPAGIVACLGRFTDGEVVQVKNEAGSEIARGLSRYDAEEIARLVGHSSGEIAAETGRLSAEVIHRDDLVLLDRGSIADTS